MTPGSVVYRNSSSRILQYAPTTARVGARPLVIVPPMHQSKILHPRPRQPILASSRMRWRRGHRVHGVVAQRARRLGGLAWDDYVGGAIHRAPRGHAIARSKANALLGFCVGGTILACALAVLAARKEHPRRVGDLAPRRCSTSAIRATSASTCPRFLAARGQRSLAGEHIDGSELTAFASLRPNELVWNYVVGSYMKRASRRRRSTSSSGTATRPTCPGPMYVYYLRNMYLGNRLREQRALTMCGVPVDLSRINVPTTCSPRARITSCRGDRRTARPRSWAAT